ncbi:hypothetical protein HMPREF1979_02744 [Actinomyces johnsonii F0542]|uniref:Uncharacterized protein n=1 Tax=Actinomyces johnsonii F0542 TaxID=1321818 RepID=U1RRK7_9ACTO|nr:hypothetical protein HMPREF1979_02744 [Actinomyces johnsonii F0542]
MPSAFGFHTSATPLLFYHTRSDRQHFSTVTQNIQQPREHHPQH